MTQSVDTTSASDAERSLPSPKERRRLREAAELTHDEVAAAVGVTPTTVRSWETGRTAPRGRKLEVYSRFLTRLQSLAKATSARADTPAEPEPEAAAPGTDAESSGTPATAVGGSPGAPGAFSDAGPHPAPPERRPAPGPTESTAPRAATPAAPRADGAPDATSAVAPPATGAPGGPEASRAAGTAKPRSAAEPQTSAAAAAAKAPGPRPAGASEPTPADPPRAAAAAAHGAAGSAGPTPAEAPRAAAEPDHPPAPAEAPSPGLAQPDPATPTPTPTSTSTSTPASTPAPSPAPEPAGAEASGSAGAPPTATAGADPQTDPQADPDPVEQTPARLPVDDFDALHAHAAPALTRQAYLLTGRRGLALEAVDRAFQLAWDRWPEVATDPDPVGWVRAAAHEYALSPWHQFRRAHRHPDKPPAEPADRILLDAMLALPTNHRRTVLLYDGVGLDLPDTAAETEASTPTAGNRLLHAHATLAARIPQLAAAAPEKQSALLRERFTALKPAVALDPRPAAAVRNTAERRNRRRTRAVIGLAAVIAVATAYTTATAPTKYEPPNAPGANVSGVPPHSGPQRLTEESRALHDKLRSDPAAGPARITPKTE
ncbi:helix-turn-helix domain-containing protein [Streptomyces sp. NPDC096339]|uniref:helix-turn-helix domain-containing protein n=1 Tax=Streptomyces sp. NPDC096339 TaxID=3366086 RepID=UPI00382A66AE